jgi:two-component system sensor histidine kinase/response regulator
MTTTTPKPRTTTATILVVEDDGNLLEGIRNILEIESYDVLTAQDGVEALEILHQQIVPPDLIVSDIMMPHMSGIELLEEVHSVPDWVSIPVIFLTAKGEKADIQLGKRLGVDDYVTKPYDPVDLLVAIESRLDRHQTINAVHMSVIDKIKRDILTILNHEFRTPLTFVVAYSDMLNLSDIEHMNTAEILSFLKGISIGADRLRRLVENFIAVVELQTGEADSTFRWRKTQISDVEQIMCRAREAIFEDDEIDHVCEIYVESDLPTFTADEEYLQQAMYQLLSNAVKFSDPKMPIEFRARAENNEIVISVKDYGRGIPPAELDKIWLSFHQVNRAVHEDQGAGSGLAIVKGIVELHGGSVTVSSKEHLGSIFSIHLPLA